MASLAASISDRIAKKVGEGFDRPNAESQLPIDINYAKLAEWLVDRKQVPTDWNRKLQAMQSKVAMAVKELPPGYLGQLEGGEELPVDYLRAKEILDKLTQTAEKSFLGSYKGAAGEWDKIVRAYEYNMLHMGEAALALGRNGEFEIPLLKKQAAKYQQQLSDMEKRQGEAKKSAAAAASAFQQECNEIGIDGKDIRGGLLALTADLPKLVTDAVDCLSFKALGQALQYYQVFASNCSDLSQASTPGAMKDAAALLPVIEEIRESRTERRGSSGEISNVVTGSAHPSFLTEAHDQDATGSQGAKSLRHEHAGASGGGVGGISWELGDAAEGTIAQDASVGEGISWDLGGVVDGEDAGLEAQDTGYLEGATPLDVSWDIDVTTTGEEGNVETEEQAAEQQKPGVDGDAKGEPGVVSFADYPAAVQRLIEDSSYRARLMDDLLELQAFLNQRQAELTTKGNELLIASVPPAVQHVGADTIASMQQSVEEVISSLTGNHFQQLILLRSSSHYLDRMVQLLTQKAGQETKFLRASREAEAKRGELQRQLMADSAKLAVLVKHTRTLLALVETVLGSKLGRRVNVMGEINNLI